MFLSLVSIHFYNAEVSSTTPARRALALEATRCLARQGNVLYRDQTGIQPGTLNDSTCAVAYRLRAELTANVMRKTDEMWKRFLTKYHTLFIN